MTVTCRENEKLLCFHCISELQPYGDAIEGISDENSQVASDVSQVLIMPRLPHAMRVGVPVAGVYAAPFETDSSASSDGEPQLETQALLGELVVVKEFKGKWAKVECLEQSHYAEEKGRAVPETAVPDGWIPYPGWMKAESLVYGDTYTGSYVVTAASTAAHVKTIGDEEPLEIYMGTRLCPLGPIAEGKLHVVLPGGRLAWLSSSDVAPVTGKMPTRSEVVGLARKFMGAPFLMGGLTICGMDCSGMTTTVFRTLGVQLPRNAQDQYCVARPVSKKELKRGDLVFLTRKDPKKIHHAIIYAGGEMILESTMTGNKVRETTFKVKLGESLRKLYYGATVNEGTEDIRTIYFGTFIND